MIGFQGQGCYTQWPRTPPISIFGGDFSFYFWDAKEVNNYNFFEEHWFGALSPHFLIIYFPIYCILEGKSEKHKYPGEPQKFLTKKNYRQNLHKISHKIGYGKTRAENIFFLVLAPSID